MKIFLDDLRDPPTGDPWLTVRNASEFKIAVTMFTPIDEISFDNDLGAGEIEGWEILNWLRDKILDGEIIRPKAMGVHSMNTVAKMRMLKTIEDIYR